MGAVIHRRAGAAILLTLGIVTILADRTGGARAARSVHALGSRSVDSLLVEQHNVFRQEERAANIYKMHWNDSCARAAERWVSRCDFKHELSGDYGENLYYDSNKDEDREILLSGLESWHDEKRGWRYSSEACGAACHYTQMVWSSTTSVGCSFKRCPSLVVGSRRVEDALYLACFYYPRGNWIGEYPFKPGRPCSSCGSDECLDGLCADKYTVTESKSHVQWNWSYQNEHSSQQHQGSHTSWHRQAELRHDNGGADVRSSYQHHHYHHEQSQQLAEFRRYETARAHATRQENEVLQQDRERVSYGARHATHYDSRQQHQVASYETRQQNEVTSYASRRAYGSKDENQLNSHRTEQTYDASRRHSQAASYASERVDGSTQQNEAAPHEAGRTYSSRHENEVLRYDETKHRARQDDEVRGQERRHVGYQSSPQDELRRAKSPLELLREDTHWCRDRLPSCRTWTRDCLKSKAVYLACPRTCGQCHSDDLTTTTTTAPATTARHAHNPYNTHNRPPQQQRTQRPRNHSERLAEKLRRQKLREEKRNHRRQQRYEERKRNGRQPGRKGQDRRGRVHPKRKTTDRRAEHLAQNLRRKTSAGLCADDPKYTESCGFWASKGFCSGNELLSTVYCAKSCGTCSGHFPRP